MGYNEVKRRYTEDHGTRPPKAGDIVLNEVLEEEGFLSLNDLLKIIGILESDGKKDVVSKIREGIRQLENLETSSDLLIKLSKCDECVGLCDPDVIEAEGVAEELQQKGERDFKALKEAFDNDLIICSSLSTEERYRKIEELQKITEEETAVEIESIRSRSLMNLRDLLKWLET
jgi:hypothetical protein